MMDMDIYIPIDKKGDYDINQQIALSQKYNDIAKVKGNIVEELNHILNKEIVFQ